jgi:hypothetical protein
MAQTLVGGPHVAPSKETHTDPGSAAWQSKSERHEEKAKTVPFTQRKGADGLGHPRSQNPFPPHVEPHTSLNELVQAVVLFSVAAVPATNASMADSCEVTSSEIALLPTRLPTC